MKLYILRHGDAEIRASKDSLRPLSPKGIEDISSVARQFVSKQLSFERCLVSPFLRAQQSAELFLSQVGFDVSIETFDELVPENRAVNVINLLSSLETESVLIVSHNPLLSELLALLTEGNLGSMRVVETSELFLIDLEMPGIGLGEVQMNLRAQAS